MKSFLTFAFLFLFLNTNQAQYNNCDRWSMGVNFTLTNPIDEMSDNEFRANYGITFNGLYNLNPQNTFLNFHIGGKLTGGMAIGEKDNIILEDPEGVSARSSVYNTLVDLSILGRMITSRNNKIKVYFDIFGGGRLLGANQDIRLNRRRAGYDRRTSERLNQSSNWAWGTGSGLLVHLNKNVYLDFGINYTQSGTNDFVNMSSVRAVNDIVQYDIAYSTSNSIGFHLGFHFKINCQQQQGVRLKNDKNAYDNYPKIRLKKRKPKTKKSKSK